MIWSNCTASILLTLCPIKTHDPLRPPTATRIAHGLPVWTQFAAVCFLMPWRRNACSITTPFTIIGIGAVQPTMTRSSHKATLQPLTLHPLTQPMRGSSEATIRIPPLRTAKDRGIPQLIPEGSSHTRSITSSRIASLISNPRTGSVSNSLTSPASRWSQSSRSGPALSTQPLLACCAKQTSLFENADGRPLMIPRASLGPWAPSVLLFCGVLINIIIDTSHFSSACVAPSGHRELDRRDGFLVSSLWSTAAEAGRVTVSLNASNNRGTDQNATPSCCAGCRSHLSQYASPFVFHGSLPPALFG